MLLVYGIKLLCSWPYPTRPPTESCCFWDDGSVGSLYTILEYIPFFIKTISKLLGRNSFLINGNL